MTQVDIRGLDRVRLLKALWEKSPVASFFWINGRTPPKWDENLATKAVLNYIDYFQGRVIKSDLRDDMINPRSYDRDNGEGAFQRIVDEVRKE